MTTALMAPNTFEMNSLSMSPGQNLDGYISAVRQFEVLSAEEERELAERFYYDEDLDAARELVLRHLRISRRQLPRSNSCHFANDLIKFIIILTS